MRIETYRVPGHFDGRECFVHARACHIGGGDYVMTLQKLDVSGSDLFSPLYASYSSDGGRSWSEPRPDDAFTVRTDADGTRRLGCDATPLLHRATGTVILCGHTVAYAPGQKVPISGGVRHTFYSTLDRANRRFTPARIVEVPDSYEFGCATGCSQFVEDTNGDLLIPVAIPRGGSYATGVMRCEFDGETLRYKGMSNELYIDVPRGLYEGSLCKFGGRWLLTLRNDAYGHFSVGDTPESFGEPRLWRWDDGEVLENYNTQQHWLELGGSLYLVYTRRAGNNDHVFRHRAPLFMSRVDPDTMRLVRESEIIVVPERGARLGNFGVTMVDKNHALITAAEWMQPKGCEKYGSDNTIFAVHVYSD